MVRHSVQFRAQAGLKPHEHSWEVVEVDEISASHASSPLRRAKLCPPRYRPRGHLSRRLFRPPFDRVVEEGAADECGVAPIVIPPTFYSDVSFAPNLAALQPPLGGVAVHLYACPDVRL